MQVAFKIVVDGKADITSKIADRLVELEIIDRAGVKSDRLTLVLDDRDAVMEIPRTGAKLAVWLGYVGQQLVKIGQYAVDGVELSGPLRTMTISANAADMTGGIKAPKERSFHKVKFGDLVKKIAKEHGLTASIPQKLAERYLGHIDQTESDMQLLTRICADQGATMKVADGRLIIADRASGKTSGGKDLPVVTIRAEDCANWSATIQERSKYKSVKAYWQDRGKARRTGVTAGSGTPMMTLKNSYASKAEAEQAANSKLKALARGTGTVQISGLVGNPSLTAEAIANLQGFRTGIDGSGWVIDQVTHRVSGSGYTNTVDVESKDGATK